MTTLLLLLTMALVFWSVVRDGPWPVLRTAYVVVLFAVPIWMVRQQGVFDFGFRQAIIVALFVALPFRSFVGMSRPRLLLGDVFAATLFLSDVATGLYWGPTTVTSPFQGMAVWLWPYMMGRLLAQSADDLDRAAKSLWWVGLGLGAYALVEAVTKVNPVNAMFGVPFYYLEQGEGYRWGMKRAQGPLEHPIHFGMMMTLLWPWTVQAAPKFGKWGWVSPALVALAVFVTVSRGAWVVGSIAAVSLLFFHRPRLRPGIALALVATAATLWMGQDEVMKFLRSMIGEQSERREYVLVKGQLREYSGTLHRPLLSVVYEDALRGAGTFGYGASDNLRVPFPPGTDFKFRSIDDYYLIVQLQYGSFGLFALLSTGLCGLAYLGWTAWDATGRFNRLAGGLFGACAGILLILNTVAFPPGFSGPFLFAMGVATGLERLRRLDLERRAAEVRSDPPATGPLRALTRRR